MLTCPGPGSPAHNSTLRCEILQRLSHNKHPVVCLCLNESHSPKSRIESVLAPSGSISSHLITALTLRKYRLRTRDYANCPCRAKLSLGFLDFRFGGTEPTGLGSRVSRFSKKASEMPERNEYLISVALDPVDRVQISSWPNAATVNTTSGFYQFMPLHYLQRETGTATSQTSTRMH